MMCLSAGLRFVAYSLEYHVVAQEQHIDYECVLLAGHDKEYRSEFIIGLLICLRK
jgi:hypothetical protein